MEYQYNNKTSLPWVIKNLPDFLFPNLAEKVNQHPGPLQGVLATENKVPRGLILSEYNPGNKSARIASFVVHPDHHGKGIGTNLLAILEKSLKSEGCQHLEGNFRTHWTFVKALKKVLKNADWSQPREDLIVAKGEARKAMPVFACRIATDDSNSTVIPFSEINNAQRSEMLERKNLNNWYPDLLNPFRHEKSRHDETSLALLSNNKVEGWVISHQIGADINEFTSLFLDPKVRSYKTASRLIGESLARQSATELTSYLVTVKADNRVMRKLFERNAAACGVFLTKSMYVDKHLSLRQ